MYVGTLTADEVVYAGAKHYVKNSNYYLSTKSTEAFWLSASKYKYGNDEAYRMFHMDTFYFHYIVTFITIPIS